ncbi:MAG: HNH endonuclease [Ktedonobacteraceae bacterium]
MSDPKSDYYSPPDWQFRRGYILRRDGYHCRKCGSTDSLHVHHIVHRSEHYDHSASNLITLCHKCHGAKHGIHFESERELYARRQEARHKRILVKLAQGGSRIKARKPHSCVICGAVISPGESYIRVTQGNPQLSIRREYPGGADVCSKCV